MFPGTKRVIGTSWHTNPHNLAEISGYCPGDQVANQAFKWNLVHIARARSTRSGLGDGLQYVSRLGWIVFQSPPNVPRYLP
jgi:hypothetical protein